MFMFQLGNNSYWTCSFCESQNEYNSDYCGNCEEHGCTKDNHLCDQ